MDVRLIYKELQRTVNHEIFGFILDPARTGNRWDQRDLIRET